MGLGIEMGWTGWTGGRNVATRPDPGNRTDYWDLLGALSDLTLLESPPMRVYSKMWAAAAVPVLLLGVSAGGCSTGKAGVVSKLADYDPAPDLGRPGWIRATAGFGAWIGGGVGFVASLALLPITYPTSLLMDEPLGRTKTEYRFMFVGMCASALHYTFGAPLDGMDFILRRAWTEEDQTPGYDFTPMPDLKLRDPATQPMTKEPETKEPEKKEPETKAPEKMAPEKKEEDRDRPAAEDKKK